MRKIVFGLSALVTFSLFMSPAMAETKPSKAAPFLSAADRAFLASLAGPVAPARAAKPAVGEKALCTATANCGDGTSVYCESNTSTTSCSSADRNCPGERGHVTCNGVTTWCPAECTSGGCGPNFCTDEDEFNCAMGCSPCDYTFTCNTTFCFERCRCHFSTCPI